MDKNRELAELSNRMSGIGAWLDQTAAHHLTESRHLDIDTSEAAYWHAGYHQALADAIRVLSASAGLRDTAGMSNHFPRAASGEENSLSA
ncbi:MAG TPA: hypothetical protein PLD46_01625 [Hyphomicrobium sp.]|nr:hypothetical protein [Hyphomicrobium sp.]